MSATAPSSAAGAPHTHVSLQQLQRQVAAMEAQRDSLRAQLRVRRMRQHASHTSSAASRRAAPTFAASAADTPPPVRTAIARGGFGTIAGAATGGGMRAMDVDALTKAMQAFAMGGAPAAASATTAPAAPADRHTQLVSVASVRKRQALALQQVGAAVAAALAASCTAPSATAPVGTTTPVAPAFTSSMADCLASLSSWSSRRRARCDALVPAGSTAPSARRSVSGRALSVSIADTARQFARAAASAAAFGERRRRLGTHRDVLALTDGSDVDMEADADASEASDGEAIIAGSDGHRRADAEAAALTDADVDVDAIDVDVNVDVVGRARCASPVMPASGAALHDAPAPPAGLAASAAEAAAQRSRIEAAVANNYHALSQVAVLLVFLQSRGIDVSVSMSTSPHSRAAHAGTPPPTLSWTKASVGSHGRPGVDTAAFDFARAGFGFDADADASGEDATAAFYGATSAPAPAVMVMSS